MGVGDGRYFLREAVQREYAESEAITQEKAFPGQ